MALRFALRGSDDLLEREAEATASALVTPGRSSPSLQPGTASDDTGAAPSPAIAAAVAAGTARGGTPLERSARAYFEPRLGHDLAHVRVHAGPDASASAAALGAHAYTVGSDIVMGAGTEPGGSRAGARLLGHELAHVVQQSSRRPVVQRQSVADVGQDALTEDEIRGLSPAEIQRELGVLRGLLRAGLGSPLVEENLTLLEQESRRRGLLPAAFYQVGAEGQPAVALAQVGVELDPDDLALLGHLYPSGISLDRTPLIVGGFATSAAAAVRTFGYRVTPRGELSTGVETYVLRVGHGRAIVVASRGGPSVMLDAGAGRGLAGSAVQGLSELVAAGLTTPPTRIQVSHTDADHLNELGAVLRSSGMNAAEVEIGLHQYRNRVGQADFLRAGITLSPGQSLIEIDVVDATGVHRSQRILGNMEMTELRLVAPAARLGTPGLTKRQYRAQKNASSPVTVVRDLVTGDTQVFTADGEGHVLGQIIDIVGEDAFRDLIGGAGATLRAAEYPHHGGKVGPRAAAAGIVRMLRLQFEASRGDAALFTQTTQRFAGGDSASIRVLDLVGVPVQRVTDAATGGAGGTSVVRIASGRVSEVTIDRGVVQQVAQLAAPAETEVMLAQKQRARLAELRSQIEPLRDILLSIPQRAAVAESLSRLLTEVDTRRQGLDTAWSGYWQALESASTPSPGLRVGIDLSGVDTAVGTLRVAAAEEPVRQLEASYQAHEGLLSTEVALIQNGLQMFTKLSNGDYRALQRLRSEQVELLAGATRILGGTEVEQHVRDAWASTQAIWSEPVWQGIVSRLGEVAAERQLATTFHTTLSESLGARLRSQEIVEQSSAGTSAPVAPRTRVGAGLMLLVQLADIGFDLWQMHKASVRAEEIERQNRAIRGRNMVQWWLDRGVAPEVALVDDDDKVVSTALTQEQIYAVLGGTYTGDVPSFGRVVVTWVTHEDRMRAVANLMLTVITIEDWMRIVEDARLERHERGWTPFLWNEGDASWETLLWDRTKKKYTAHYDPEVAVQLAGLRSILRAGLQRRLLAEAREKGYEMYTLHSSDRTLWVYERPGRLEKITLGWQPLLQKGPVNNEYAPVIGRDHKRAVYALDADTWIRLRQTWWYEYQRGQPEDAFVYKPNENGTAWTEDDYLLPLPK